MDKFQHHDGLKIKRSEAFDLTQQMMLLAMSRRIYPMLEDFGVMNDLVGEGLSEKEGLRVERVDGDPSKIKVKAGYAIMEDATQYKNAMIVLDEDETITISDEISLLSQIGYVMIDANEISEASGDETYMPGRLGSSTSILLLRKDSYTITIETSIDSDKIVLAAIALSGGNLSFIDTSALISEVSTRPYIDSNDTSLTVATAVTIPTSWYVTVEKEQAEYSGYATKVFTLSERGSNDTTENFHRNGATVTISPIVDLRQTNSAKLKQKESAFLERILKGIIDFNDGSGDRIIRTRKLPDVPNAPAITTKDLALMWINKQVTEGPNNDTLSEMVAKAKTLQLGVGSAIENIGYIKSTISSSTDDAEKARLTEELITEQKELLRAQNNYSEKSKELSYVRKAAKQPKKYVLSLTFNQPALIDSEQIIQYEAEVIYLPLVGKAQDKMSTVKNQIFTKQLLPAGINEYGDKTYTYDTNPDIEYRTMYMPVHQNERLSIRVRSVTEDYIVSTWTDAIEYSFDGLTSSDVRLAMDLDEFDEAQNTVLQASMLEMTELFRQTAEDLNNSLININNNTSGVGELRDLVTALTTRVKDLEDSNVVTREMIAEDREAIAATENTV